MTGPPSTGGALPPATNARLLVLLGLTGVQTIFWIYTFFYIGARANPKGDGMEWLAVMPMSFIFFALVFPVLLMGISGRALRTATILALIGAAANFIVWSQILGEFAGKG
ncbi:MAG: hypothetical protein HY659_00465 [Rhizobiales bacterium]|nr:hypothetical protein [Hyphomicrobiales bacterium]